MFNTIIRNNHFEAALFSNIMSIISISSFIGALTCRSTVVQRVNGSILLCCSIAVIACCLILLSLVHVEVLLLIIVGFIGFANAFFLINMNIKLARYVIGSKELIAISPLINGFMTTCFYVVSFLGPLLFNQLLQHHIAYSEILISCGCTQLLLLVIGKYIKTL